MYYKTFKEEINIIFTISFHKMIVGQVGLVVGSWNRNLTSEVVQFPVTSTILHDFT